MNIKELLLQNVRPFPAHPNIDRYFPGGSVEDARIRLTRSIERGDGPGLIIGASGTGKSLLLHLFAEQFRFSYDVALLSCSHLSTDRALLQAILFALGLPSHFPDEGDLRLTLLDHLAPNSRHPNGILLLVDEAQSLPVRLLEELRLLTNVVRDGEPRVRLVLAGSPLLEEHFTDPELESLQQRIAARCYLAPLGQVETSQYVQAHLSAAGANREELFSPSSLDAVYEATNGIPRLINQLCDRALAFAHERELTSIDRQLIQEAWADIQQLPTPWDAQPEPETGTKCEPVVEFGGLEESQLQQESLLSIEFESNHHSTQEISLDVPEDVSNVGDSDEPWPVEPVPPTSESESSDDHSVVDPFREEFEEEEVVLDRFASLGDVFHATTPKVEDRTEDQLSELVQHALDICESRAFVDPAEQSVSEQDYQSADVSDSALPSMEQMGPLMSVPLVELAEESAPLFEQDHIVVVEEVPNEISSATIKHPVLQDVFAVTEGLDIQVDRPVVSLSAANEPLDDTDVEVAVKDSSNDILVVEEEAVEADAFEPTVRRQEYRQLFATLRGN